MTKHLPKASLNQYYNNRNDSNFEKVLVAKTNYKKFLNNIKLNYFLEISKLITNIPDNHTF